MGAHVVWRKVVSLSLLAYLYPWFVQGVLVAGVFFVVMVGYGWLLTIGLNYSLLTKMG